LVLTLGNLPFSVSLEVGDEHLEFLAHFPEFGKNKLKTPSVTAKTKLYPKPVS
jgi:hypothetical protein